MAAIAVLATPAGALAAGGHGRGALSLASGRTAIARYAMSLRDAVAGAQPDAPMSAVVEGCRRGGGVVTCMATWSFAGTRCSVEIAAVADRGILVEELGEATCTRPAPPQAGG